MKKISGRVGRKISGHASRIVKDLQHLRGQSSTSMIWSIPTFFDPLYNQPDSSPSHILQLLCLSRNDITGIHCSEDTWSVSPPESSRLVLRPSTLLVCPRVLAGAPPSSKSFIKVGPPKALEVQQSDESYLLSVATLSDSLELPKYLRSSWKLELTEDPVLADCSKAPNFSLRSFLDFH